MENLGLKNRANLVFDVTQADFYTRRELLLFVTDNQSPRAFAALVAEFVRAHDPIRGKQRILAASLESARSGWRLGSAAWEQLLAAGWSEAEITYAGQRIYVELANNTGPSPEGVGAQGVFLDRTPDGRTSGPTG